MTETKELMELVDWRYDSGTGLFSKANTKESKVEIYLTSEKGRSILEDGKVAVLNNAFLNFVNDPYFIVREKEGYTRRARKHGDMKRKMKEEYPELERKLERITSKVYPYGEYVYISLADIDNYNNPITKEGTDFYTKNFVPNERFNKKFLLKLIDYQPRALTGGIITNYRDNELPQFLKDVSIHFPELYEEVLEESEWLKENHESITSYVGKHAKVKTLNSGKVKVKITILDEPEFEWDGEQLTHTKEIDGGEILTQTIIPTDDMVVEILDNDTVTADTVFVDKS